VERWDPQDHRRNAQQQRESRHGGGEATKHPGDILTVGQITRGAIFGHSALRQTSVGRFHFHPFGPFRLSRLANRSHLASEPSQSMQQTQTGRNGTGALLAIRPYARRVLWSVRIRVAALLKTKAPGKSGHFLVAAAEEVGRMNPNLFQTRVSLLLQGRSRSAAGQISNKCDRMQPGATDLRVNFSRQGEGRRVEHR
jgi:hypothetical protein